jgi:hypothetical protein
MKPAAALTCAMGFILSACAPHPSYVAQAPIPLVANWEQQQECALIRKEIVRQQRIAESSGVMATALVEASVRLNVSNVISGLETRAAIAGCPV